MTPFTDYLLARPASTSKLHDVIPISDHARRRRNLDRLDTSASAITYHDGSSIYLDAIGSLLPSRYSYALLDTLRETIPLLDAGLLALRQITGLPRVVTNSTADDRLINDDFMLSVHVGHAGYGYDTYLDQNRDNALHYGHSVSEIVPGPGFKGVESLKITDPRTFGWRKKAGGFELVQTVGGIPKKEVVVEDYTWINYWVYELRRGHPQGYSVLWKLEYPAQIAQRILHAALMNWKRMGNPSIVVTLKAAIQAIGALGPDDPGVKSVKARLDSIMGEVAKVLGAHEDGRMRDFGQAIGTDEELIFGVLGEPGKLIDPVPYWDMLLDQFVSKLGMPAWLFGLHRGTTERLSSNELQMVNSRIDSRRRDEEPLIRKDVAVAFAMLGRPNVEFKIEWAGVTLDDIVEKARARLMNSQSESIEIQNEARRNGDVPLTDPVPGNSGGNPADPGTEEPPPQKAGNGNRLAALRR